METKRNAIMNAIASGQITNLLANCTWNDGYFDGSGNINTSHTNGERYESEYIDVDTTKTYMIIVKKENNNSANWVGYNQYDSELVFKGRVTTPPSGSFNVATPYYILSTKFTNPKVRVSLRTYGIAEAILCDAEEVIDLLSNFESLN